MLRDDGFGEVFISATGVRVEPSIDLGGVNQLILRRTEQSSSPLSVEIIGVTSSRPVLRVSSKSTILVRPIKTGLDELRSRDAAMWWEEEMLRKKKCYEVP